MAWAPDYCTVTDLRSYLRVEDEADDLVLGLAISAASRAIDRACNRQFGKDDAPTGRFYTAHFDRGRGRWIVPIDDLMDATGFTITWRGTGPYPETSVETSHTFLPASAPALGRPYTSLSVDSGSAVQSSPWGGWGGVEAWEAVGTFGWTAVPASIEQATLLQASRFVSRRDSPYGIAGSPDVGSELRLLNKLDPDVEVSVAPYRRVWGAVR